MVNGRFCHSVANHTARRVQRGLRTGEKKQPATNQISELNVMRSLEANFERNDAASREAMTDDVIDCFAIRSHDCT